MNVNYVGFYPIPGIDRQEYFDWLRIRNSTEQQAVLDISAGNVPPGMLFEWKGRIWQVYENRTIGRYM